MNISFNTMHDNKNAKTDVLTEQSFYPPFDNRLHYLGIEGVLGGDSYDEYLVDFWTLYEDELFD